MGHALAVEARRQGAVVTLVTGPTALADPTGVRIVHVQTVTEMQQAVLDHVDGTDAVLMAAAVGDWSVPQPARDKMKKTGEELTLHLRRTPDILAELGARRGTGRRPLLVGFAAETGDLVARARDKLRRKNLDRVVANRVDRPDSGFTSVTNQVTVVGPGEQVEEWPLLDKSEVARRLVRWVASELRHEPAAGLGDAGA